MSLVCRANYTISYLRMSFSIVSSRCTVQGFRWCSIPASDLGRWYLLSITVSVPFKYYFSYDDICKGSKLRIRNGNHSDLTCSNNLDLSNVLVKINGHQNLRYHQSQFLRLRLRLLLYMAMRLIFVISYGCLLIGFHSIGSNLFLWTTIYWTVSSFRWFFRHWSIPCR